MKSPIHLLIYLLLVTGFSGCRGSADQAHDTLRDATAWLWQQQSSDGGWHSVTHAVLEDGKALTPYILYHLLQVPDHVYPKPAAGVESGLDFIQREIRASMQMNQDSLMMLNYPNYSAAYALRVLKRMDSDTALQRWITEHLLREQFTEHRGITADHLAYGGWGYGEPGLPYGQHGHVDISHTRRILEALGEREKAKAETEAIKKALFFLQGVQRDPSDPRLYEGCISRSLLPYDGGFVSSVVTLSTNKSIPVYIEGAGYHYPSYATATSDGLLALHALGLEESTAYQDARQWLMIHYDMHTIEGLDPDDPEMWVDIMQFYHLAVRAEAMSVAGIPGKWRDDMLSILIREQHKDGYYFNPIGGVNKEDDPLMATVLAVQALSFVFVDNHFE